MACDTLVIEYDNSAHANSQENLGTTSGSYTQSFKVPTDTDVCAMSFYGGKGTVGTQPGTYKFEIRTAPNSGSILATTGTLSTAGMAAYTVPAWHDLAFSAPVTLTAGTQYYLYLKALSGSTNDVIRWFLDTTGSYTDGVFYRNASAFSGQDMNFRLFKEAGGGASGSPYSATVNSAKVTGTHTNYPAYIDLANMPADFWTTVANGGGDIRCYSDIALTNELAREVVSCDTATNTGELHVKVPTFDGTTVIYIDVDGARSDYAVGATYGRNAVWSDYKLVYHLKETGNGTLGEYVDSTGNGYNGQGGGGNATKTPAKIAGKVGDGQDFTPTDNDYIDSNVDNALDVGTLDYYHSSWFKTSRATASVNGSEFTINKQNTFSPYAGYYAEILMSSNTADQGKVSVSHRTSTLKSTPKSATKYNDGVFHMLCARKVATTLQCVTDGAVVGTVAGVSASVSTTRTFKVGINPSTAHNQMDGVIDEVRLMIGAAPSLDWISTEYNNQNDASTFWTIASAGGGGGTPVTKNAPFFGGGMI